jgi:hypothetical protein
MNPEIIKKLKIIADGKSYCPFCKRFLENEEIGYSYGNSYCKHHIHNDLNPCSAKSEYEKLAQEILDELEV